MRVFHDIKVGLDDELDEQLSWLSPGYGEYRIIKKSVDARQRHNPHLVYSVEVYDKGEPVPEKKIILEKVNYHGAKPIIIGAGPAGLFAALRFVERGVACILFERGSESATRMKGINRFWRYGELDPQNNVCFGEGGAGLYSDGKLITRIKSPHIEYVMNRLVKFGAPQEIEYLSNPHVGSDRIRRVIPKMREYLIQHGCEIHFDSQVTQILTDNSDPNKKSVRGVEVFKTNERTDSTTSPAPQIFHTDKIILASGHSAEDMFRHLDEIGVHMEGKSFAVGLRIEHPQKIINQIQFRDAADHPKLGAANYKLAHHDKKSDIGVYSFCMCPGGYVLSSGTSPLGVVCNGMSNYNRNSPFANSAIVVTINHEKNFGASDKWGGLKFRQDLEERAFQMVQARGGTKEIPVQKLTDFMSNKMGEALPSSSPSGVTGVALHELLPATLYSSLKSGIEKFGSNMKGFMSEQAQLHGVESRTSCPIRVTRNPNTLESISHTGLYPCGEGA
ncbi:MAG: hypothetical protein KDD38_00630, partial [Bdellovibrionales bacterium]|nr:hypothetical protein [Bdellovibrionales bacterium]